MRKFICSLLHYSSTTHYGEQWPAQCRPIQPKTLNIVSDLLKLMDLSYKISGQYIKVYAKKQYAKKQYAKRQMPKGRCQKVVCQKVVYFLCQKVDAKKQYAKKRLCQKVVCQKGLCQKVECQNTGKPGVYVHMPALSRAIVYIDSNCLCCMKCTKI